MEISTDTKITGSNALTFVRVEDDVLHLKANCSSSCYFKPEVEIPIMEKLVLEHILHRIVIVGGCVDGDYDLVKKVRSTFARSGVDLVWVDYQYLEDISLRGRALTGKEAVNHLLFGGIGHELNYDLMCTDWVSAKRCEIILPHLVVQAKRLLEVKNKIAEEQALVAEYPILRRVKSFSMVTNDLELPFPDKIAMEGNAIVGFTESLNYFNIIGKSQECRFEVSVPLSQDKQRLMNKGLILGFPENNRLSATRTRKGGHFLLETEAGLFYAQPHPEVDPTNPNLRFIPLWQRLRKHQPQEHRSYGDYPGGDCIHCNLPGNKWKVQSVCLVLSRNLKEGYWEGPSKS